ncbi:hypothetical protein EJB05_14977, partial [Eragrostis curvula]
MEQHGGEIAAMRPNPTSSDADAGEDRLSALPDDILVLILLRLGTSDAGQTSVLSRRWRVVWALLPELTFPHAREPNRIRDALQAHQSSLLCLSVEIQSASLDSVAAWLLVAARRLAGRLKSAIWFRRETTQWRTRKRMSSRSRRTRRGVSKEDPLSCSVHGCDGGEDYQILFGLAFVVLSFLFLHITRK